MFVDMACQPGISPGLRRIAEILRLLAGNIYDPGLFIICDLGVAATAWGIKQSVLYAALRILAEAEHNAFTVDADFVGDVVNRASIRFQK